MSHKKTKGDFQKKMDSSGAPKITPPRKTTLKKNYLQQKGEDLLKTGKAPLSSKDRDLDYTTHSNDDFNVNSGAIEGDSGGLIED
jgi:hypothetical protein